MKKADKMGESADLQPTSISVMKNEEVKPFHKYLVFLITR